MLHLSVVEAPLIFAVGASQASDPLQASCQVLGSRSLHVTGPALPFTLILDGLCRSAGLLPAGSGVWFWGLEGLYGRAAVSSPSRCSHGPGRARFATVWLPGRVCEVPGFSRV